MPYFTSDGANIFVDSAGAGRPVLLLHGFSLDHRQWTPQRQTFAAAYAVHGMDLRGHGRSATTERGYTYSATARDVERAMVQVGMDRRNPGFLVAHSLSCDAALQAALHEPHALQAVVVVTPAVWGHRWSDDWLGLWRALRAEARSRGPAAAFERFRADVLFDGLRERAQLLEAVRDMQAACTAAHLFHDERETGAPTLDQLGGCKVPVLAIAAREDRDDFKQAAAEIASRAPGATCVELAGSRHFPNLEIPQQFNDVVLEFLTQHG